MGTRTLRRTREKGSYRPENNELYWSFLGRQTPRKGKRTSKILMPKTVIPGWRYLAIRMDTEDNAFGLWQEKKKQVTRNCPLKEKTGRPFKRII